MRIAIALALSAVLVTCAPRTPPPAASAPGLSTDDRLEDFDQLWSFVQARYAFFNSKATDWSCVRKHYRFLAGEAPNRNAFIRVLEDTLDELYDPHTHLQVNLADSWRLPPYGAFVSWDGEHAVVTEATDAFLLHAGDEILKVDDTPIADAIAHRLPRCLKTDDRAAEQWALLSLVAGRHDHVPTFRVANTSIPVSGAAREPEPVPAIRDQTLKDGIGWIRISSFADASTVEAFDAALERHRDAPGLILDVRENGGGDTAVGVPILGRFFEKRTLYAHMARRQGAGMSARWDEYIEPRGPWTYTRPLVVLVDHFSESFAEGFAMALQETGRAKLIGTRMAGLDAGVVTVTLQHSGIPVQVSAEPVYRVDGRLRSATVPNLPVDDTTVGGVDAILLAAIIFLTPL